MTHALVVANWKMELSYKASLQTLTALENQLAKVPHDKVTVVVCPSFPVLHEVSQAAKLVEVGAQNVHWEEDGPVTGEVSVTQLTEKVKWCIIGHSERRALVGETDEQVARKAQLLQAHKVTPVVCVGESLAQREQGETVAVVTSQIETLFADMPKSALAHLVIAYEPLWAIGSGVTPDVNEIGEVMFLIRKIAANIFGRDSLARLRLLYGGSVSAENCATFAAEPGIDGFLVGGASLHPRQFTDIVEAVQVAQGE